MTYRLSERPVLPIVGKQLVFHALVFTELLDGCLMEDRNEAESIGITSVSRLALC